MDRFSLTGVPSKIFSKRNVVWRERGNGKVKAERCGSFGQFLFKMLCASPFSRVIFSKMDRAKWNQLKGMLFDLSVAILRETLHVPGSHANTFQALGLNCFLFACRRERGGG